MIKAEKSAQKIVNRDSMFFVGKTKDGIELPFIITILSLKLQAWHPFKI